MLESDARNIQADTHVDAFLTQINPDIMFSEVSPGSQQRFKLTAFICIQFLYFVSLEQSLFDSIRPMPGLPGTGPDGWPPGGPRP